MAQYTNRSKATTAEHEDKYVREDGKRQTKQRDLQLESARRVKNATRRSA